MVFLFSLEIWRTSFGIKRGLVWRKATSHHWWSCRLPQGINGDEALYYWQRKWSGFVCSHFWSPIEFRFFFIFFYFSLVFTVKSEQFNIMHYLFVDMLFQYFDSGEVDAKIFHELPFPKVLHFFFVFWISLVFWILCLCGIVILVSTAFQKSDPDDEGCAWRTFNVIDNNSEVLYDCLRKGCCFACSQFWSSIEVGLVFSIFGLSLVFTVKGNWSYRHSRNYLFW